MKDPFAVIKKRYVTEKSKLQEDLHNRTSNPSLAKCKTPKYVFEVNVRSNKADIALAIEEIYKEHAVKVLKVNTVQVKGKPKRRGRTRPGATAQFKKAIVTLEEGNVLVEKV